MSFRFNHWRGKREKKNGLLLLIGLLNITINQYVAAADGHSNVPIDEDGKAIISGDSSDFVGIWVPVYFVDGMGPSFNFDDVQMKSNLCENDVQIMSQCCPNHVSMMSK